MDKKSRVRLGLRAVGLLEGVLPTRVGVTEESRSVWSEIGQEVARDDISLAQRHSRSALRSALPPAAFEDSAVEMLSGSEPLREQVSGFAAAGIGLFHASGNYLRMSPQERRVSGGSEAVTRVMIDGTRILLEPPRLVAEFDSALDKAGRAEILGRYGLTEIGANGLPPGLTRLACDNGLATDLALALIDEDAVIFAEPDFVEHIGQRHVPQDPDYARQWHHAIISAETAWDLTRGEGVRVVVIDNGFEAAHDDLVFGSLSGWYKPSADFTDADLVRGIAQMPIHNHGTACAGMIAAVEGNDFGGCGIAHGCDLSAVACIPDQIGTQSTLARALAYAVQPNLEAIVGERGADIISCSLGPNGAVWRIRQVLADAIDFAATSGRQGLGTTIFWATTNGNFPIAADEVCSHADVIAVGRSTEGDLNDDSGFGSELDFLAPGVSVWLPAINNNHVATTGTSFAAPAAAGVCALALSRNLALDARGLRAILRRSCDKIGHLPYVDGRNPRYGSGRINALKTVQAVEGATEDSIA